MPLRPGVRLGAYEIHSAIGSGGMGEVYRATDTSLGRQVAVKVLPEDVAADPERVARFEREAKTLAALNHPNIAQIYGLQDLPADAGSHGYALVMELVEGPTLADRIVHGAIPLKEVLPIAKQIAEALEAAHEQGIIHRDLKPANIKVREDGTVKVLDFGLAKAMEAGRAGEAGASAGVASGFSRKGLPLDEALPIARQIAEALEAAHEHGIVHRDLKPANIKVQPDGTVKVLDFGLAKADAVATASAPGLESQLSTTVISALTQAHTMLGTPAYMSPEQVRGEPVDRRADVWAFGCVLYEMLAGRRLFTGATQPDVLAGILAHEPDLSGLPRSTPAPLVDLLRRCLKRDPGERRRALGDVALQLADITSSSGGVPEATRWRSSQRAIAIAAAAAVVAVAAAVLIGMGIGRSPVSTAPVRVEIDPPVGHPLTVREFTRDVTVSPDGTRVAYIPVPLFSMSRYGPLESGGRIYDTDPKGPRFLMLREAGEGDRDRRPRIAVVQNWTEELKRLVPTD